MPPTLDLSRTTHKMIVSPPRINLRRTTSYSHEKGPLSSTSSRFNFNHLVFASPPPSPGLPQLLPRRRKPSNSPRPRRVLRAVLYLAGLVLIGYAAVISLGSPRGGSSASDGLFIWPASLRADGKSYEMVGRSALPDYPTPVIMSDSRGSPKWTVSIPPNYNFPLAADEYVDICAKCEEVSSRVDALRGQGGGISLSSISSLSNFGGNNNKRKQKASRGKRAVDRNFVDVHEAEVAGFLPGSVSIGTLLSQQAEGGDLVGETEGSLVVRPVCARSLTFVLASSDAGLGRTLMLLWMAYTQAQNEGRGFFIDDTRWAYGKYAHIFAPPPSPDCRAPLRHEMLPCPRQARHLVMTIDTARDFFFPGSSAETQVQDLGADYNAHLFDLARRGYEALFRLNEEDSRHVASRVEQLKARTRIEKRGDVGERAGEHDEERGLVVGMHVRRGDRRPVEFQYRDSYMPLNLYTDRAYEEIDTQHKRKQNHHQTASSASMARSHSLLVLASDDPMVYEAEEFAGAARAQEHIRLASKAEFQPPEAEPGIFRKFVDETFGWEGGFFAAMFWNLGRSSLNSAASGAAASAVAAGRGHRSNKNVASMVETLNQMPPSAETLRIRSLVGRAYMMDLAVLAEASDTIVCAVSATGCRLLAVMMGWDAAVEQRQWINIDGNYGWWAVDF